MDLKTLEDELNIITKNFESYLREIQVHQVSPMILKNILIDTENSNGKKTKSNLMNIAFISVKNNKTLVIEPKDTSNSPAIYKALTNAKLNANTSKANDNIEMTFLPITSEDREKFVKTINESLNGFKMQIKTKRQDFLNKYKKLSKEEFNKIDKKVQEKIDKTNKALADLNKNKITELSKV